MPRAITIGAPNLTGTNGGPGPSITPLSAVGNSNIIPLDNRAGNIQTTLGIEISGTVTATMYYTTDNLQGDDNSVTGRQGGVNGVPPTLAQLSWTAVTGLSAITASAQASLNEPATAVYLAYTAGTGTCWGRVLQASALPG